MRNKWIKYMWSKIISMVSHHRIFRNFRTGLPDALTWLCCCFDVSADDLIGCWPWLLLLLQQSSPLGHQPRVCCLAQPWTRFLPCCWSFCPFVPHNVQPCGRTNNDALHILANHPRCLLVDCWHLQQWTRQMLISWCCSQPPEGLV